MPRHAEAALLLFLFASCSSLGKLADQAPAGPADAVIVFGSLRIDSLLLDQPIDRIVIAQVDPAFPRTVIEPCMKGSMFFTEPLPVGRRWRIASFTVGEEQLAVVFPDDPGKPSPLEFCPREPGLFFLGSLELPGDAPSAAEVRRMETPDERAHLQTVLDAMRGTSWEPLVRARIRSLAHDIKS